MIFYTEYGLWPEKLLRIALCMVSCVLMIVALVAMPFLDLVRLRQTNRDRRLTDHVEGLEEYAVEIVVWANRKKIGADRGVAWFDGPLLGFSGSRTSFLVSAEDLIFPRGPMLSDWDLAFHALKPKVAEGKAHVHVRPLLGHGRRYRRKMRFFIRARVPSDLPRQWPPLEPFVEQVVDETASRGASLGEATDPATSRESAQGDVNHLFAGWA